MDEPDGLRELIATHSDALLRTGWLLTGDWAAAEDLVQTALAAAWQRWPRAMRDGRPEAYVRAIMTTTFLGWRRRRWTGEVPSEQVPDVSSVDPTGAADTRASLRDALALLPPRQRAAVVLRFYVDLSEAQTAAAMGCSAGAVKSHTSRALARLRSEPSVAAILTGGVAP